jgi:hypothetical protein
VTDSGQVSPTKVSLSKKGTSLSAICDPLVGIQHFLWGIGKAVKFVSRLVHGATKICVISWENNS